MDIHREILHIIANQPEPVGWYGIQARIGMKGIVLDKNLLSVLKTLEDEGYLTHKEATGHPHGVYQLTDRGKRYLEYS